MNLHVLGTVAALATVGSSGLTWLVRTHANRRQLLDRPNERSAHTRPTPRLGGIGVMITFVAAAGVLLYMTDATLAALVTIGATCAVAVLGFVDDVRSVRVPTRLAVQALAAASVVASAWVDLPQRWSILGGAPPWILAPISILWLMWLTNLFNFMDGIDGLAGGQAVIAAVAIAIAAFAAGAQLTGSLLVALAAASLGFLLFNFPPASIFMGDVGSTAVGFFLGSVPFLPGPGFVPVDTVAIALSLFILDATVTLALRIARGEPLSKAHRSHYYQRPLALGVPHRTITVAAYLGMLVVGAAAASTPGLGVSARWALIGLCAVVFAALAEAATHPRHSADLRDPTAKPFRDVPPGRLDPHPHSGHDAAT